MYTERERAFSRLVAVELAAQAKRRGVSQQDLAVAAGVTPEHFSHTVAGRKGLVTVGVLLRAAERLDLNPQVIVASAYEDLLRIGPAAPAGGTPTGSVAVPSRPGHAPSRRRARG